MIRNWYNQIPYPALKTKREITKYIKPFSNQIILFELQHGFREKRSCETQLIMPVDELSISMQIGKQTDLILLDFE